mgnify:CR=1 FL=1
MMLLSSVEMVAETTCIAAMSIGESTLTSLGKANTNSATK